MGIKNQILSLYIETGLSPYTKERNFQVSYTINLENPTSNPQVTKVIAPLPANLFDLQFYPENASIKKEEKFLNTYILWQVELKPKEKKNLVTTYKITSMPSIFKSKKISFSNEVNPNTPENIKSIIQELPVTNNPYEYLSLVNQYIQKNLSYGDPVTGLYSTTDAISRSKVDCGGYSSLFIALCKAVNIKAELLLGFWLDKKAKEPMHAWVEVEIDNEKFQVDPTINQLFKLGRANHYSRLGLIPSDRVIVSTGSDLIIEGEKIKILQHPHLDNKNITQSLTFHSKTL